MNLATCVECGAQITEKDEMLPDFPGLYQCPKCGHPNGWCTNIYADNKLVGKNSSIKGFMPAKGEPK